jgi:hypothetical protein
MDFSLCGEAFPSKDFSSEFQFDCAFGFDGEFDFGMGGTSTSSARKRVDSVALLSVPIHLIMTAYQSIALSKTMCHLGAVVATVFVKLIAIFGLRV